MKSHRKDIDINHTTCNRIDQTVFFCDAARPHPMEVAFQWLWFSNARKGMLLNISKQRRYPFHHFFIAALEPIIPIFQSLWRIDYFHKSSSFTDSPLPFLMSSCACISLSSIRGDDIRYSVSFIVCFWLAIRFKAFTAFFIRPSSSEIICRAPNNSEFNCNCIAVMFSIVLIRCKDTIII